MPKLVTEAISSTLDKFERKISGRGAVRAWKWFNFIILNDDMDDINKIKKSLEYSGLLIDGATETVEHEIKKQEGGALPVLMTPMAASLIAPMAFSLKQLAASSFVKGTFGKGVSEKEEEGFLTVLEGHLLLKGIFGNDLQGLRNVSWYITIRIKNLLHSVSSIEIT